MDREPMINPSGEMEEDNDLGCTVVKAGMSYEDAEKLLAEKRMKGKIAVEKLMEYSKEELKDLLVREGLKSSEVAKRLNTKPSCVHILRKLFDLQEKDIMKERMRNQEKNGESSSKPAFSNNNSVSDNKNQLSDNKNEPISTKIITDTGHVAAGELIGTVKALERMEGRPVKVKVIIWES